MRPTQRDPWQRLGEALAGHLQVRARGLFASDFVLLDGKGTQIGRLGIHGTEGAELGIGEVGAKLERVNRSGYRMLSAGTEILTSTGDAASPGIMYLENPYEANLSLLRNTAEAGPAGHPTTIRIKGGLTNRNYEASFDLEDEGSLPVTLFLLYRLVSLRREAYRTG